MLEVEVFGADAVPVEAGAGFLGEIGGLCELAASSRGVEDGHVAVEFVSAARITELNERHRGKAAPTDVLSFPIDGVEEAPAGGPLELGDIVICAPETEDLREAVIHGMLHLLGMDHETDSGEMLALQDRLMSGREPPAR